MALYLGRDKLKVCLDGVVYHMKIVPETFIVHGAKLLSLDDYTFRDVNGLYITSEESE